MIANAKGFVNKYGQDLFFGVCVILISVISYNLGRIRAFEKTPLKAGSDARILSALDGNPAESGGAAGSPAPGKKLDTRVVSSKNSDKYHFTWCSGAKRIKEENKIWFETADKARAAGYMLAGNCQ